MESRRIGVYQLVGGAMLVESAFHAPETARAVPAAAARGARTVLGMQAPVRVHPALDPTFELFHRVTEIGFACSAIVVVTRSGRVRADSLTSAASFPMRVVPR